MTWQQYFLQFALDTWHSHQAMALTGTENGYVLPDDLVADKEQVVENMKKSATEYGYADLDEFMASYMGPGCSFDDYLKYMDLYYQGFGYLQQEYDQIAFDAEEVDAYFQEHTADGSSIVFFTISSEMSSTCSILEASIFDLGGIIRMTGSGVILQIAIVTGTGIFVIDDSSKRSAASISIHNTTQEFRTVFLFPGRGPFILSGCSTIQKHLEFLDVYR